MAIITMDRLSMKAPRTTRMSCMISTITSGWRWTPVASSISPAEAPEKARIWLNSIDAAMIRNIIADSRVAPISERFRTSESIRPMAAASAAVPTTPSAALSEGVATPKKIRPTTRKMIRASGATCVSDARSLAASGTRSGT